jgi:hypothetical protein
MHADPGTTQPDNGPGSALRKSGVVVGAIIGGVLLIAFVAVCPRILRNLETADERGARIDTVVALRPAELRACEQRATAFYKKQGTFPTLADGRDAAEVMRNRCSRDPASYR